MYLSVFMGPVSAGPAQDAPLIDQSLALAEASAAAGYAMVTFGEQHFSGYEPYCNPFLMAARLSPVLGDTWFGTTIVPLPFHPVFRLAEESAVADVLTRGRFLMGLSAGRAGYGSDFSTFGVDEDRRDEAFASKIELLGQVYRRRIGEPPLVVDTPWDAGLLRGRLVPTPFRDGGPQLAVGTNTDEKIDDVAARGLALFLGPCRPDAAAAKLDRHRRGLAAHGFDDTLVADRAAKSLVTRYVVVAPTEDEAWATADGFARHSPLIDRRGDPRTLREMAAVPDEMAAADPVPRNVAHVKAWYCVGTPDSVTKQMLAYPDLGVEHVNVRFQIGPFRPDPVQQSFDLFTREVLPALSPQRFAGPAPAEISPHHRPDADVTEAAAEYRLAPDRTDGAPS